MPTKPTTKALIALAACSTLLPLIAMAPDIKRESNQDRDALTELETKPLNAAALASLTDWSHPGTLDESKTAGKVVVLAVVDETAVPEVLA